MGEFDDDSPRRTHVTGLGAVQAIDRAFSDPLRLAEVLSRADTYDEAAEALSREFQITEAAARDVMDNQVKLFTRQGAIARKRQIEYERAREARKSGQEPKVEDPQATADQALGELDE